MPTTRRQLIGGAAASLAILCAERSPARPQAMMRLHGLIIGINAYNGRVGTAGAGRTVYRKIAPLLGCINDAEAIAAAALPIADSIEMLLDEQVSRAAFFTAWEKLVARSRPGDVLLVTYSGHGGQERAAPSGRSPDGLYDTFIMPNLDTGDPRMSNERIRADEMQAMLASVAERNKVIFLADSCHAGGMAREPLSTIAQDVRYRTVFKYSIEAELQAPIRLSTSAEELSLPHVMFLSGADHGELVPELRIDGRPHGALSVAFASALAGRADDNGDGVITGAELSSYVLNTLRTICSSAQHPNVRWPRSDIRSGRELFPATPLFQLKSLAAAPKPPQALPVALRVMNVSSAELPAIRDRLKNVVFAQDGELAEIYWDAANGTTADGLGSVLAHDVGVDDLQAALDGLILIKSLQRLARQAALSTRLQLPGEVPSEVPSIRSDCVHLEGSRLSLVVQELKHRHFVAFNITGTGEIQLLFPTGSETPVLEHVDSMAWPLQVQAPFGGDHVAAINSAEPLDGFVGVLRSLGSLRDAATVATLVQAMMTQPGIRVGVQGIFTARRA